MELTVDQVLERGVAAHREGKLQEAEGLYRAILKAQPKHADANHNLGVLAVGINQAEKALPYFLTANDFNPDNTELNFKIGVCYLESYPKKNCLSHFKKVDTHNP